MAKRPKVEWVSGAELGRQVGVSKQAISAAVKVGRIAPNEDGLFDLAEASRQLRESSADPGGRRGPNRLNTPDTESPAKRTSSEPKTKLDWSVAKEREQYLKLRLERRALQGSLVKREVVEHEFAEIGVLVRDRFRSLGKRLRDQLAAEVDARRCGELIEAEVDEILRELSASRRAKDDE